MFTASPQRKKRGIDTPTTPAITLPVNEERCCCTFIDALTRVHANAQFDLLLVQMWDVEGAHSTDEVQAQVADLTRMLCTIARRCARDNDIGVAERLDLPKVL